MQQLQTRIVSERSPFVVFAKGQVQITLNGYVPYLTLSPYLAPM